VGVQPLSEDLAYAGAARLAALLRARQASARELTGLYLDRIERIDPQVNAYRDVWAQRALAEADAADARLAAGEYAPLLGVPIAIKDTLDVAGDVTAWGSAGFDVPARRDSVLVRRLREAGCVILGKTNLPELAIHGFTESATFGATRNPWDTSRTPGGSSGGAGAAMAAGLAALAHASDGAGSIRYPAAHCGLFGLKPQRGRVPIDRDHWHGLSVNGCVSHSVADTALFLDAVIGGNAFGSAAATPPGRLRIAVSIMPPRAVTPPLLGAESRQAVVDTFELLAALGHAVAWRDPDWGSVGNQIAARYLGGIGHELASVPHPERLEPLTRGYGRLAKLLAPDWAVRRSLRLEESDRSRINTIFDDHDVLIMPMTAGPAFEIGRYHRRGAVRCLLGESRFYPYAVVWNHTGQPAASVPAGLSVEGLPLAVQLVGRPSDEATLLRLAAQLEIERPWAHRRPAL